MSGPERDALADTVAEVMEAADNYRLGRPQRCGHSSEPMCCPFENFPTLAAFFTEAAGWRPPIEPTAEPVPDDGQTPTGVEKWADGQARALYASVPGADVFLREPTAERPTISHAEEPDHPVYVQPTAERAGDTGQRCESCGAFGPLTKAALAVDALVARVAGFSTSWDRGYVQGVQDSAYAVRELRGALSAERAGEVTVTDVFEARMNDYLAERAGDARTEAHPMVNAVRDYLDNAGITPDALRYAATHEALCRPWIFDLLTGLADTLATQPAAVPDHDGATP